MKKAVFQKAVFLILTLLMVLAGAGLSMATSFTPSAEFAPPTISAVAFCGTPDIAQFVGATVQITDLAAGRSSPEALETLQNADKIEISVDQYVLNADYTITPSGAGFVLTGMLNPRTTHTASIRTSELDIVTAIYLGQTHEAIARANPTADVTIIATSYTPQMTFEVAELNIPKTIITNTDMMAATLELFPMTAALVTKTPTRGIMITNYTAVTLTAIMVGLT